MSGINNALRSSRDMDEYLEVHNAAEIIDDIKAELNRNPVGTLRDFFAGQVIASLLKMGTDNALIVLAADAYRIADAMLAERQKETK